MSPRKNTPTTRGKPFAPGNPGRPQGARHKATVAAESLLDGEAGALTRKAIDKALEGDTTALRLCLERICPPRKDRPISFTAPRITSGADVPAALAAIFQAVASGDLTPGEAADLAGLVDRFRAAYELESIESRIAALEAKNQDRRTPE